MRAFREKDEVYHLDTEIPAGLNLQPQAHNTLEVLDDLRSTELGFAVETVDESDGTLVDLVAHGLSTDHHLHLEAVSLALGVENHLLQHRLLVKAETARQVTHAGHQHDIRDQVGSARSELAEQVPAVDTALDVSAVGITGSGHNVGIGLLLNPDHFGNELGVVAEVGVHDDDEVAGDIFQAVHVGGSKTELALTGLEDNVFGAIELLELLRDLKGAVRGSVVDNNNLPIQLPKIRGLVLVVISILGL